MIALALAAQLLAAAPPRDLPDATAVLHFPRLDRAAALNALLERAGARSPLVRPATWRADLFPLLGLDLASPKSLASAGMDPAGAFTVSFRGDDRISCVELKDPAAYDKRLQEIIGALGTPWKSKRKGAELKGVKVGERVAAGYVVRGREACTVSGNRNVLPMLEAAAEVLARAGPGAPAQWKRALKLPGVAFVSTPRAVFGLRGEADSIIVESLADPAEGGAIAVALAPAADSPYAQARLPGLLLARLRLGELASTADAFRKRNLRPCRFCDAQLNEVLSPIAAAVAADATGNALLFADRMQLRGSIRSEPSQYFAVKNALLVELARTEQTQAALDALPAESKTADGWELKQKEGVLRLGLRGKHFFVANEAGLVEKLLASLDGARGKSAHAAEVVVEPRRIREALSQISLLDVMGSRELAGLFAVGTELGPLLADSAQLSAWADPAGKGSYRWSTTWTLRPANPAP